MPNPRSRDAEADSAYEEHRWVDWEEGEMEDTVGEELEASLNNTVKRHLRAWEQQLILPQG